MKYSRIEKGGVMSQEEISERFRARRFLEILEGKLKGFSPGTYAPIVSSIIDSTFGDFKMMSKWPPHYLVHSIEANCAYHRNYRDDELTEKKLINIVNHYTQYFDPVAKYFLTNADDGIYPFIINMTHQQLYLQNQFGVNDIGRSVILFLESQYNRSEKLFEEQFGLTYLDWLIIGFGVHAGISNRRPAYISPSYLLNTKAELASEHAVLNFFRVISVTPDEVKRFFNQVRTQIGSKLSPQLETYIQGIFDEKPLLKLGNDNYLAIHKPLFLKRIAEGIFDLSKSRWPGEFGNEFGKAFERYAEKLLLHFLPKNSIVTEKNIRKITNEKTCDFIINNHDCLLLIECKGTEYSSYTATVNAMKHDNSTKKISNGMEQLYSTAKLIHQNVLNEILGDTHGKKIIAIVVTFKQLYLANINWYWEKVISSSIDEKNRHGIENIFEYRPQIFSINELEQFLLYSFSYKKSFLNIFKDKLEEDGVFIGDWSNYLELDDQKITMLASSFDQFVNENFKFVEK